MGTNIENSVRYFTGGTTGPKSGNAVARAWKNVTPVADEQRSDVTITTNGINSDDRYTVAVPKNLVRQFIAELAKDETVTSITATSL